MDIEADIEVPDNSEESDDTQNEDLSFESPREQCKKHTVMMELLNTGIQKKKIRGMSNPCEKQGCKSGDFPSNNSVNLNHQIEEKSKTDELTNPSMVDMLDIEEEKSN